MKRLYQEISKIILLCEFIHTKFHGAFQRLHFITVISDTCHCLTTKTKINGTVLLYLAINFTQTYESRKNKKCKLVTEMGVN